MTRSSLSCALNAILAATLLAFSSSVAQAQWTAPTPEELSMTSQPEVPGARAVYLFREETTDDKLRVFSVYARMKILTEGGKELNEIELPFSATNERGSFSVDDIQGRTIHPDGTVIPFKPYQATINRPSTGKLTKIFTLPDMAVGNIIEYRYKLRYSDSILKSPQWYIQSSLWTRKAHYSWAPLDLTGRVKALTERGELIDRIFWSEVLPNGAEVKETFRPSGPGGTSQKFLELDVRDIPPIPHEAYMPPVSTVTYRVQFYLSSYRSGEEFWREESKYWAAQQNKFIGPSDGLVAATHALYSDSETQDEKLRKIYAAIMKLDNISFSHGQLSPEERALELKEVHSTDDIWKRKRGSNVQLTELFVAMARAAGMHAYIATVTSRNRNNFTKSYLSFSQLDGYLAIVEMDGNDRVFDPGARFCPYGRLVWQKTQSAGIRQTKDGAEFFQTPAESYTYSRTQRVANLAIDSTGNVSGTLKMTYMGYPNLGWRQSMISGNIETLKQSIRTSIEHQLTPSLEIEITSIEKLEEYEEPLVVHLNVKGTLASSTATRLLIPADIFEVNAKASFPEEKRELPVNLQYPRMVQDAIQISFPSTLTIESLPANDTFDLQKSVAYDFNATSSPTSLTCRRNYSLGRILYQPNEYADLRAFYTKMENKDQESVVLTTAANSKASASN